MDYTLSLTRSAAETLQAHLLADRDHEQMAITLCGANRLHRELRLLVRDVILLPPDAFCHQSAAGLELKPEVQAFIHQRAARRGLVQVDWHSHPGAGPFVGFSPTDDRYEAAQAAYLAQRMGGVPYGSVVVNDMALDARLWLLPQALCSHRAGGTGSQRGAPGESSAGGSSRRADSTSSPDSHAPRPRPMHTIFMGDLARRIPLTAQRSGQGRDPFISPIYDRQVRAFGVELQRRLGALRVGLVGLGGLGSAVVSQLSRLGVRDWVLVDPDVVELSNLNRLINATTTDARKTRPKVYVARSTVRQSNPKATILALRTDLFDPAALHALKACDLLIIATDNHSSRMVANRLAAQYLIPLVHLGCNISATASTAPPHDASGVGQRPSRAPEAARSDAGESSRVSDVSAEFAIPDLGRWCLRCAGIIDLQAAAWELAPDAQRSILRQRGYVVDTPAPAVSHLDGVIAALAAAEVHNLAYAFRPQHRYLVYDGLKAELVALQVPAAPNCPICSPEDGVLGLGDLEPLPDYRRQAGLTLPAPHHFRPPSEQREGRPSSSGASPDGSTETCQVVAPASA